MLVEAIVKAAGRMAEWPETSISYCFLLITCYLSPIAYYLSLMPYYLLSITDYLLLITYSSLLPYYLLHITLLRIT